MTARTWLWLIALAAAAVGTLVAPGEWTAGPATVRVAVDAETVAELGVEVGSTAAVEGDTVVVPDGVPTDGAVVVEVTAAGAELADVDVELVFADGSTEAVPAIRVDGDTVVASRQAPHRSAVVLALLGLVMVLWVSELVPLHVTGLAIPVVLAAGEVTSAADALAPFFDPIVVLFFAGFLMAEAMQRVGLDRLAAAHLVGWAGGGPVRLFAAILAVSAFLSMWMSNTAAVTVMIPVAMAVTAPVVDDGYRRAVVLGLAYAATVGGVGSAIGTPANPLAIAFLDDVVGRQISFLEWFAFGLPVVVIMLPVVGVWVWTRSSVTLAPDELAAIRAAARDQQAEAGPLTRPQLEVLGVFSLVVAGWLTQSFHDVSPGIVALAGAVVLMVIGRVDSADLGRISWPTLLTFGGGLALGTSLVSSGTSDWIVTRLAGLDGLAEPLALLVVGAVTLALTTVASNTASAATLIPLAIPLAGVIGVDPVLMVVLVAATSSIDFALVIGTPPTMLAYDTGLFTAGRIFTVGIVLDVIGVVVVALGVVRLWEAVGLAG